MRPVAFSRLDLQMPLSARAKSHTRHSLAYQNSTRRNKVIQSALSTSIHWHADPTYAGGNSLVFDPLTQVLHLALALDSFRGHLLDGYTCFVVL